MQCDIIFAASEVRHGALLSCVLIAGGVFLIASIGKLRDIEAFRDSLAAFGVASAQRAPAAAIVIASELITAPLIVWPRSRGVGFALAAVLLAVFAVAIARAVRSGAGVRCRCFGAAGATLRTAHVARNAVLAVVASTGLALTVTDSTAAPLSAGGAFLSALVAVTTLIVIVTMDDLLDLLSPTADRGAIPE